MKWPEFNKLEESSYLKKYNRVNLIICTYIYPWLPAGNIIYRRKLMVLQA